MTENESTETAAETQVSASNDNIAPSSFDVLENLTDFYENRSNAEGDQTESETALQDQETSDADAEEAELAEEIENSESEGEGEQKPEDDSTESEESDEEIVGSDFDALKSSASAKEFPDLDALKAKFPRQSKEFYAYAAELSADAKKNHEQIESLGGESNIEPLARISSGIKDGDSVAAFTGITELGSKDALLKFVSDTLHLGFVHSQKMQENPEYAEFGKELESVANQIIVQRFGEDYDLETIQKLTEFNQSGWMEKIADWKEAGFVDADEWEEQLAADESPKQFQSLKSQLKATTEQLEQARQQIGESAKTATDSREAEFTSSANEQIERSLNEVVWKKSVLRDLANDSDEMKSQKSFLRGQLASEAKVAFGALPDVEKLKTAFKTDAASEKYKDSLTAAIEQSALRIREKNSVAESIVARLYNQTRNGSLAKSAAKTAAAGQNQAAPTQTNAPAPAKPKTNEEVLEDLKNFYAQNG